MRRILTVAGAIAAAGIFVAALAAHGESHAQESGLAVGVQGAFSDFEGSIGSASAEESGVGGGLALRYTTPVGGGTVAGVQASWSFSESAEWSESASYSEPGYSVSGTLGLEVEWSADLLARVGFDIGGVNAYVAGGFAFVSAESNIVGQVTEGNVTESASISDSASYTGYKLAAGVDLPVADSLEAFIQVEYADYGEAKFFDAVDIELTALGVRTGLLYRF